jgi:hypothetical protein
MPAGKNETDYFISCNTTWGELMYRLKERPRGSRAGRYFAHPTWPIKQPVA